MATELLKSKVNFGGDNEGIVIVNRLADIPGGASLKTEGYTLDDIKAGQIVYKDTTTGEYSPLPINDKAYQELPENGKMVGVVVRTVPTETPMVAIMTAGQVNAKALPYPVTDEIIGALPRIEFLYK